MVSSSQGLRKLLRPADFVLILFFLCASFFPLFVFQYQVRAVDDSAPRYAVIRIDGKEVDRFRLDTQKNRTKTYYPAKGKYNTIEIKDGRIRDKEDNSPDQIAVKTGWIEKNGQTSICLPHKLVIEIVQEDAEDYYIY